MWSLEVVQAGRRRRPEKRREAWLIVREAAVSFLLHCPNCGERSVYEFRFGGEYRQRPTGTPPPQEWADFLYTRKNTAGEHKEWWYHQQGCRMWFFAVRDTVTNTVRDTFGVEDEQER